VLTKKTILCILLALSAFLAQAADADSLNFLQRLDRRLYNSRISKLDTTYIGIPVQRWSLYTMTDGHMNHLYLDQHGNGAGYSGTLFTTPDVCQNLSLSWHGTGISVPIFNPKWVFPSLRNKNVDYSFTNYGNKVGFSVTVRIYDSHSGEFTDAQGEKLKVKSGDCHDYSSDLDFYYAFNGSRFSMPAAFAFSQVQKKSAGSFLFTTAIRNGKTVVDTNPDVGGYNMTILSNLLAMGGGYGYNLVTERGWLVHMSLIANLVVMKHYEMQIGPHVIDDVGAFPDVVAASTLAFIKNKDNFYYGLNLVNRSALCGSKAAIGFFNSRGNAQLLFGLRF